MSDLTEGASPDGGGVKGTLTKKVGPLPVWGYGVIAVGGFVAYRFLQSRSGATAAVADPNATIPAAGALTTATDSNTTTLSGQLTDLQGTDTAILTALQSIGGLNGTPAPIVPSTPAAPATPTGTGAPDNNGYSYEVQQIFHDLLPRPNGASSDPGGAAYYTQLSKTMNPADVFLQIENSVEAQQLAANNPQGFINGQYQYGVGRTPDAAGAAFWTGELASKGVAQESRDFIAAAGQENKALGTPTPVKAPVK